MKPDWIDTVLPKPFHYIVTFTTNENGFRAVIVDEQSNPPQHTALECVDFQALIRSVEHALTDREKGKTEESLNIPNPQVS